MLPDGSLKTFAVHLIKDARASRRHCTPRALPARTAFGAVEGEPVDVVVKFAPAVADFIRERRWHPSQQLEPLKDGGLLWRATLSGEHEFIGWVMSWSPWSELVSPSSWRQSLHARAKQLLAAHASES